MAASHPPPVLAETPLVLRGVTKRYGAVQAVAGINLVVHRGATVGLVGPNGSGKTTVLHVAAGLVGADGGSATVMGAPAGSRSARERCVLVPDDPAGLDELRVDELSMLARGLWGAPAAARAWSELLLAAFGLGTESDLRIGDLSRGRRRQAFLAALLSLAPELVLVDEATATLDPEAVFVLREAMSALAERGSGVLIATQDLHFAETACDRLVVLDRGTVIAHGTPASLCVRAEAASLEEAFLTLSGSAHVADEVRDGLAAL